MKSYASNPQASRGRLVAEEESANRSVFQRDRDRIIHSTAFRRLAHKTQVFVYHEGDHYRTRLTHSIEVAQIARSIAHTLDLNEDLAEAVALAHDLGHTPFGHAGEEALDLCMRDFGGFDHNEQTFRIVTLLERRYALFDGLNLTWETLEGVVKHNGPLIGLHASAKAQARSVPATIERYCARQDLEVGGFAGLEAQVAAISDDIAYNNHDLDDGLRAGLFTIADLADVPLAGPVIADVMGKYPGIEQPRLIHEAIRRMINLMVRDVVAESTRRLADAGVKTVEDVRGQQSAMIGFSAAMRANDRGLKQFLFARMYRHDRVNEMTHKAKLIVAELFDTLMDRPQALPAEWQAMAAGVDRAQMGRLVADYIAGMTDKFALETQEQLFN
jgi:dGTPase